MTGLRMSWAPSACQSDQTREIANFGARQTDRGTHSQCIPASCLKSTLCTYLNDCAAHREHVPALLNTGLKSCRKPIFDYGLRYHGTEAQLHHCKLVQLTC